MRKIYHNFGKEGFVHKGRGKVPYNKKVYLIIDELKQLYLNEYYDYNFEAFYDELLENKKYKDKYDISYSSLYREFLNDDIISPIAHKGTIKLYNEKMNNAINDNKEIQEEKIELFQSRQIAFEKSSVHDFKLFKNTTEDLDKSIPFLADNGYLGIQNIFEKSLTQKKKSKYNPLSNEDNQLNKLISNIRISVEHVNYGRKISK